MKLPADIESALQARAGGLCREVQQLDRTCGIAAVGAQPVQLLLMRSFTSLEASDLVSANCSAQTAVDICWEKLNSGYWRNVSDVWRTLYSYAALASSLYYVLRSEWKEAMRWVDMALLMGAPLPRDALTRLASVLARRLQSTLTVGPTDGRDDCWLGEVEDPPAKRQAVSSSTSVSGKDAVVAVYSGSSGSDQGRTEMGQLVPRVECPSLLQFQDTYMNKEQPVIITGSRTVPVELGAHYTDDNWSQQLMPFSEFISAYVLGSETGPGTEEESSEKKPGYLAQHQLFDQIPELRLDICVPDYCCLKEGEDMVDPVINAWFGPKGTISPLHHDPYHNLFAQVVGRKYIRLYSVEQSDNVYPHSGEMMHNTSQVDVDRPDLDAFPQFASAPFWHCTVGPGDLLYIPPKWWHYVRSLSISFSVSFWWT